MKKIQCRLIKQIEHLYFTTKTILTLKFGV